MFERKFSFSKKSSSTEVETKLKELPHEISALCTNYEDPLSRSESEAPANEPPPASINYKLEYKCALNTLAVTVIEVQDLPEIDTESSSHLYVELCLLPEEKKKYETKIQKYSINPIFNETFFFKGIRLSDLIHRTIVLCLMECGKSIQNDRVGGIQVPMSQVQFSSTISHWKNLEFLPMRSILGDVCFSMHYVPTTGKLTFIVIEAKSLKKMDIGGLSDPYVKISYNVDGKRIMKKKTRVIKRTLNPYFNECFVFDMPYFTSKRVSLVITVVDYDRIGASQPIGRVILGQYATGTGQYHWSEMMGNPRRTIMYWHSLHSIGKNS